jgi:hypothetical protein
MMTTYIVVRGLAITVNFFMGLWWVWQSLSILILGNVSVLSLQGGIVLVMLLAPWLAVIALSWRPGVSDLRA